MLQLNQLAVTSRFSSFSAQIYPGNRVHIIGPNGAGKSSLLASIAGMLPGSGEVIIQGQSIAELSGLQLSRYRSYLCQQSLPLSVMPVFQYLSLHQPQTAAPDPLEHTLSMLCDKLHLSDKLAKPVTQLSGGEWQRVRLVATLLQVWPDLNPLGCLLLLDEPANSLDIAHQQAIDELIGLFCRAGGMAIISDHDLNHTLHHADNVWLMSGGRVVAAGETAAVLQPECLSSLYGVSFQLHNLAGKSWLMTG
ncbi:MAG: vitamin B12 ABC transporter ATP-binding protein BtuD [Rouxiella aceris]|uniref:vitamin B12 ABC transporter ATP-binding protein BtuD n=1 Tax=Rouxiella aceris TaxID=2703884 RepID=UPI00284D8B6B|nr:vitamin B12 ABC transporter ATP-binding protein BtuD [Rouxiella aceris]MDR3433835.1 vitamin B12 ABC transporter ATP-binding protein BtuD [Rouxiella aceris]